MHDDKKENKNEFPDTPCMDIADGQPENCDEMVNRYGRCNVQLTNATDNAYPAIAQGIGKNTRKKLKEERDEWLHKNGEESGGKYKN